jgi:transcriptional regulator with XRE-family HTH domain
MAELPDDLVSRIFAGASPVRLIREHRGLSQNELASAAGLSPSRLRQIEETKRIREEEAPRLATALGVSKCAFQSVRSRFRGCEDALAVDEAVEQEKP